MIVVSWESLTLEQARGFVTGYDIQYTPSDSSGPVSATAPSDSSEFTISDLDRTLNYTVSVSAATTAGSGPSSPPVVLQGRDLLPLLFVEVGNCMYCCVSLCKISYLK